MPVHFVRPLGSTELVVRLPEDVDELAILLPSHRRAASNIVDHAEHTNHRRRKNRNFTGLVVERHVATSDRRSEFETTIGQPTNRLGELPHHFRILRRTEVQAVRDRQRLRTGDCDIAIRLGKRKLRTGVRIKFRDPPIAIGGERNTKAGFLVHAHHAGVLRLCEHRVAQDVAVILIGDP